MRKKMYFTILIVSLFLLLCSVNKMSINKNEFTDTKNIYNIESLGYAENRVNILYPSILGLDDAEKQIRVNDLLKKEAFSELSDWLCSGENSIEDIGLSIEYRVLFINDNYLCVNYTGYIYINNSAYPRNIFTTLNLDLNSGKRLQLSDLISIDFDFVNIVRETLNLYIDKNPEWEIAYNDKLEHDDEYFTDLLLHSDREYSSDCFSYFTEKYIGISFATYHVAGDHFEIEIMYVDIKEKLKISLFE